MPHPEKTTVGFTGFASLGLMQFLDGSSPDHWILRIEFENMGGARCGFSPTHGGRAMKKYRLFVLNTSMVSLHTETGWLPETVAQRLEECQEQVARGQPGGIRAVRFFTSDERDHLLSVCRLSNEDQQVGVLLVLCDEQH